MNSRFPKTREVLTKEWELSSPLDLGWSRDGDTLQDLHNRNNGSFDISSCYYYDSSSKLYKNVPLNDIIDPRRGYWVKKSTSDTVSKSALLNISALFPQLTHYDQNVKTVNGFLYSKNDKKYLVTVAHLLHDTPRDKLSEHPDLIKSKKQKLERVYCVSRYYDVAFFDVTDMDKFKNESSFNQIASFQPKHVRVDYLDPHSGNEIHVSSTYLNITQASIELGAVGHKLIPGASGSAVTNIKGQLVGMVTSCADRYDNMSLVIPASTIDNILSSYKGDTNNNQNYDQINKIYPNLMSIPLQPAIFDFVNDDITSGELVTQVDTGKESNILPFDIITEVKVNEQWIPIGKETNLSTQILANQDVSKVEVHTRHCNDSWRNSFGSLPRNIIGYKPYDDKIFPVRLVEYRVTYQQTEDSTENYLKLLETEDKLPGDELITPGLPVKIVYQVNSIKFDTNYITIKKVIRSEDGDKIYLENTIDSVISQNIYSLKVFYLSSSYNVNCVSARDGDKFYQQRSGLSVDNVKESGHMYTGLVKDEDYLLLVISHLVRHWAFLVLVQIKGLSAGYQHKVWSSECNKLFTIISNLFVNNSEDLDEETRQLKYLLRLIGQFVYMKCLEFSDYQITTLMSIFYQIWYNKILNSDLIDIVTHSLQDLHLPFDNMNKISTSLIGGESLLFKRKSISVIFNHGIKFNEIIGSTVIQGNLRGKITEIHRDSNDLVLKIVFDEYQSNIDETWSKDSVNNIEIGATSLDSNTILRIDISLPRIKQDLIDGSTTYNLDGYRSEHQNLKMVTEKLANQETNLDNLSRELDMVYSELKQLTKKTFNGGIVYKFPNFSIMKSFWDHNNITLGMIIRNINNNSESVYSLEKKVTLTLSNLPDYLQTWQFRRLLGNTGYGS